MFGIHIKTNMWINGKKIEDPDIIPHNMAEYFFFLLSGFQKVELPIAFRKIYYCKFPIISVKKTYSELFTSYLFEIIPNIICN